MSRLAFDVDDIAEMFKNWGWKLNISYPVTNHKTNDRYTNAVTDIQKFID